jgi:hypothetical protein
MELLFRCLSNGDIPPVKERLEYPLPDTWHGLTPGTYTLLLEKSTKNPQGFFQFY